MKVGLMSFGVLGWVSVGYARYAIADEALIWYGLHLPFSPSSNIAVLSLHLRKMSLLRRSISSFSLSVRNLLPSHFFSPSSSSIGQSRHEQRAPIPL
jgi:hypothetical protein